MKQNILKILSLAAFFIILSETLSLVNIVLALLVSTVVVAFAQEKSEIFRYVTPKLLGLWFMYFFRLLIEVIKANLQVAMIALSKNMAVAPEVVPYHSDLKDPWLLTILANSITLTPGTMTVDIEGRDLLIHCLNKSYVESLNHMKMADLLMRIEGELIG